VERKDNFNPNLFQYVGGKVSSATILILLTDVLDGAMVTLAIYTLNLAHPGFLLRDLRDSYDTEKKLRDYSTRLDVA
jgi:hypothetical protein